ADGFGKRGHIPDGILVHQDGKQIAIEIELTLKAKDRMERLLKNYGTRFEYKEIWYFCAPHIMSIFIERAVKMPYVKIHNLMEYL
ncbi:MAG: replication-relaxation family protein, partial [Gammaproteobacteria bacterium]